MKVSTKLIKRTIMKNKSLPVQRVQNGENLPELKVSNSLCRGIWKPAPLNIYEKRILMLLISRIQPEDEKFKEYEIKFTDILSSRSGDNYKAVRNIVESLVQRSVSIQEEDGVVNLPIFYLIRTKENKIEIAIHDKLMPYLLQLKAYYTKFELEEFFNLSSTYSQSLFLFLKSWSNCSETYLEVPTLYDMLGVPGVYRNNYADFKRRVLDPTLKTLAEKTTLKFGSEAIKEKNKVVRVKFINKNSREQQKLISPQEDDDISMDELLNMLKKQVKDKNLVDILSQKIEKDKKEGIKKFGSWINQKKRENDIDVETFLEEEKNFKQTEI